MLFYNRQIDNEIEIITTANIVYKTLGFKWLIQAFCPASAFVSVDRYEARNPQRFIHATVRQNAKKTAHDYETNDFIDSYFFDFE